MKGRFTQDQLFLSAGASADRVTSFSCGHVVPSESLLPVVLTSGPSGQRLDFTYKSRDKEAMLDELNRVLINTCNIVPGGIVCFLPSYDYENRGK